MALYTHRVADTIEITSSSKFLYMDIQINTRKDMWWKEDCYSRFIITFLTIIVCFTSFSQGNFGVVSRKRILNSTGINQLPVQS